MDRRLYIVSNIAIDSFLNQVSKEIKDEIILERSLYLLWRKWIGQEEWGWLMGKIMEARRHKAVELIWMRNDEVLIVSVEMEWSGQIWKPGLAFG